MSTALTVTNGSGSYLPPPPSKYDDPGILRTIKETVCKDATESQFKMFIEICKTTGLNPFLKEVWFVPGVGIMAARDGYLRVANDHPMFDGMETRVERDTAGIPIKAVCTVWRKDRGHPIVCEAYYNEYKKTSSVWSTYKSAMIGKVAEVLALKRSFAINGVVTEEEIGQQKPQQERGSKEAADAVAQRKLAEMRKAEADRKAARALEVGTHDVIQPTESPTELEQQLTESLKQANPDKFEALQRFAELKAKIVSETGSDEVYYSALGIAGYEKSNQIPAGDMRKVYLVVVKAYTDWKGRQPMPEDAA